MMGRQQQPEQLFYTFQLERHVPSDHLLRDIDGVLDLRATRRAMQPYYADTGRPSVDPELMIRMLNESVEAAIRRWPPSMRWALRLYAGPAVPCKLTAKSISAPPPAKPRGPQ